MWRCCAVSMLLFYHCCGVARLLLSDCLLQDQTKLEFAQDSSKSCKMELSKFLHGLFEIVPWICQVIIYMFLNLYWTKPSWSLTYILKLVDWLKELNKVECLGSVEPLAMFLHEDVPNIRQRRGRGAFPCFGGLGDDGGSAPDKHPSNEQLPCLGIHLLPSPLLQTWSPSTKHLRRKKRFGWYKHGFDKN